jgi:hypothetical protein
MTLSLDSPVLLLRAAMLSSQAIVVVIPHAQK